MRVDITSPWYPYAKPIEGYYDLKNTVDFPRRICDYLLDAPKGEYAPIDDNAYPRCRFWKYLFYDGAKPLDNPLPTIAEKMKVLFNPAHPIEPPTERGYRLIPQIFVPQAQTIAQTRLNVFLGRTMPSNDEFKVSLAVEFDIWVHYAFELNTKTAAYSRAFAIEQSLIEAFHGVNMEGMGTFSFSRVRHPDCGSRMITDGDTNIGRRLTMALEIATTADPGAVLTDNMPIINTDWLGLA